MPFNWENYLNIAREVRGDINAAEEHKRAGISRAYYAAMHVANLYANGCDPGREVGAVRNGKPIGMHSAIPTWFKNRVSSVVHQEIGEKLGGLRNLREYCDYDADNEKFNFNDNLEFAILEAETICNLLRTTPCPPVRTRTA